MVNIKEYNLNMNERTDIIITKEEREEINSTLFILAGLGGVGGGILEMLVRFGANKFVIADKDIFEDSNLNRQILSLKENLNRKKTEVGKERILSINPEATVFTFDKNINEESIESLDNLIRSAFEQTGAKKLSLCDAIDDARAKVLLYKTVLRINKDSKIVASMGAGRALLAPLEKKELMKTHTCPLARCVRENAKKLLTEEEAKKVIAIFSPIPPTVKDDGTSLGSAITQTMNMAIHVTSALLFNRDN